MSDTRDQALALLRDMCPDLVGEGGFDGPPPAGFASELGEHALGTVFERLWLRPGLDRRARSLVTLGILIGLRAEEELRIHFPIALRNGVTRAELEEIVYQTEAYAGFPAAAATARIGHEVLDHAGSDRREEQRGEQR